MACKQLLGKEQKHGPKCMIVSSEIFLFVILMLHGQVFWLHNTSFPLLRAFLMQGSTVIGISVIWGT